VRGWGLGSTAGKRNLLGIYAVIFFREYLAKSRLRWLMTTSQSVQSVHSVAWHCWTNTASIGGRIANLLFLLLVG